MNIQTRDVKSERLIIDAEQCLRFSHLVDQVAQSCLHLLPIPCCCLCCGCVCCCWVVVVVFSLQMLSGSLQLGDPVAQSCLDLLPTPCRRCGLSFCCAIVVVFVFVVDVEHAEV